MTVPNLARLHSTSRQNIQIVVNRLKAEGLILLSPNPAHKKSELVRLTESGVVMIQRAAGQHTWLLDRLRSGFSERELAATLEIVRRMRQVLGGSDVGRLDVVEAVAGRPSPEQEEAPEVGRARNEEPASEDEEMPVSLL
jgi:hypothetical protein